MQGTGRKNIVGGWLLRQMIGRALGAMSWAAGVIGFVSGCLVGSAPAVADSLQALGWWFPLGALSMVAITCVALALVMRAVQSTWGGGLAAERRVGDRIEHALVRPGCAFAHDVKEALGGSGNVDHVVLTPAGVWVVETKAGWLKKGPFKNALRQVAVNVERVRRHLNVIDVPVRGALVIADNQESYESDHDWMGEPVTAFRVVSFWQRLQEECGAGGQSVEVQEREGWAREIWRLGSSRYWDD